MGKIFFIFLLISFNIHSKTADELGFGVGMTMISFAESESELQGDNVSEASSGSYSSISSNIYWKFFHKPEYSLYLNSTFPLVEDGGNSFFSAGIGVEYYFTQENNRLKEKSNGLTLSIDPKLRYYLVGEFNILYISYLTETSKKNDINAELAFGGGASYSFGGDWKKWGMRASGIFGRGVGVITSTINIKVFASVIYYFEEK